MSFMLRTFPYFAQRHYKCCLNFNKNLTVDKEILLPSSDIFLIHNFRKNFYSVAFILFFSVRTSQRTHPLSYKDQSWRDNIIVRRCKWLLFLPDFKQIKICLQILLKIQNTKFHVIRDFRFPPRCT
jgi:hypothetical protein